MRTLDDVGDPLQVLAAQALVQDAEERVADPARGHGELLAAADALEARLGEVEVHLLHVLHPLDQRVVVGLHARRQLRHDVLLGNVLLAQLLLHPAVELPRLRGEGLLRLVLGLG